MRSEQNLSLFDNDKPLLRSLLRSRRTARRAPNYHMRKHIGQVVVHAILIVLSILFVIPLLIVLAGSFSSERAISLDGYSLIPREFTLAAYQFVFSNPGQIVSAYAVSIFVTVVGSAASLLIMALLGYVISRRDFRFRRSLSFFTLFTMLFNGGLVPIYLIMTQLLHVQDTLLAYILPYLIVPFNVLLLRTYFSGLPMELIEAAKLDGAGEWRTFFQIVVPMSTPALATVGLLSMLVYWNDWLQGLLYITNPQLMSLQYLLYQIQQNIMILTSTAAQSSANATAVPAQSVLMAMAIIAICPIIFAFLFTQRYLVRGITLGGLKGD